MSLLWKTLYKPPEFTRFVSSIRHFLKPVERYGRQPGLVVSLIDLRKAGPMIESRHTLQGNNSPCKT